MLLVFEFKNMIDEEVCSQNAFENLGVKFDQSDTGENERAESHYLITSDSLTKTIRNYTNAEEVEESYRYWVAENKEGRQQVNEDVRQRHRTKECCPFCGMFACSRKPD